MITVFILFWCCWRTIASLWRFCLQWQIKCLHKRKSLVLSKVAGVSQAILLLETKILKSKSCVTFHGWMQAFTLAVLYTCNSFSSRNVSNVATLSRAPRGGNAPGRHFSGGCNFWWKKGIANGLSWSLRPPGGGNGGGDGTFRLAPGRHFPMPGPWL